MARIIESNRPKNEGEWLNIFSGGVVASFDYRYEFVATGCVAMLKRWFEDGMREPAERMARLAEELMTSILTAR